MKLPRRTFLHLAAGAAALPAVSRFALAQTYPARPVRIIVGFPAGTSSDIMARLIAQWLSERLGQQFIVENRPGAGTNIAAEAVVHAPPDGYTLLWVTSDQRHQCDALRQRSTSISSATLRPVASVIRVAAVMMVNPSVPAKTVPEFIAYAKANPGKINMSSPGIGSANHVLGELFKMMAGVNLVHVPYRRQPVSRSARRAGAGHVQSAAVVARFHQVRQAARACRHHRDRVRRLAGRADRRRICAGL